MNISEAARRTGIAVDTIRIERTHRELEVLDGKIAAYRELEERAAQPA